MDADATLEFFNVIKHRIYFLGKNQLMRVNNLCESVLHNVLQRPEFKVLLLASDSMKNSACNYYATPTFCIALASKRFKDKVHSMQHNYDKWVYSSQPSNAQDWSIERYSSLFVTLRGKKDMFLN